MKQMALVVSNLIKGLKQTRNELFSLHFTFSEYVKFNKDEKKFTKHMEKVVDEKRKKDAENRTSDNIPVAR